MGPHIISAAGLAVLLTSTVMTPALARRPSAAAPTVVRITAERFSFSPQHVTVPEGTAIEFHLQSADTLHGFRVLGQDVDVVIPKRGRGEASVTFTPPAPGTYVFECSRMCGAGHSFMRGTLRVRPAASHAVAATLVSPGGRQ